MIPSSFAYYTSVRICFLWLFIVKLRL
jgi:hypothetical protein